jgi:hypothetical protein
VTGGAGEQSLDAGDRLQGRWAAALAAAGTLRAQRQDIT